MKNWSIFLFLLVLIIAISACTAETRQSQPAGPVTTQATQQSSFKQPWEQEWDKIVSAAKKEGQVVVVGPPGEDVRRNLVGEFVKDFPGIEVDYSGMPGAAVVPKVKAERRAGLYTVDVHIGGTTSIITGLKDIAQPVEPLLILPEVKDVKNWADSKHEWADSEGKFVLMFVGYQRLAAIYNPQLVEPKRMQEMSYWDLTKPEFKGKIIMSDPRIAGPGQSFALFLFLHPQLGPDFYKAFAKNDVVFSRDHRQVVEWVSTGKNSIGLAVDELTLAGLKKAGIQNVRNQSRLKEGTYLTAGFGSLMVPDNVPHPNAARVYLNWFLSKKGQTAWVAGAGTPTRRLDVPVNMLDPDYILVPGVTYVHSSKEDVVQHREKLRDFLLDLLGR